MDSKIRGISVNNLEIYIMRERETKKKKKVVGQEPAGRNF